jgi:lipopolysaccharide/colanic/teichoic acid biosynthesis glycosyltransferase
MKRLFDFTFSFLGLIILSPILFIFMFLVWLQDCHSPFYIAQRVGRNNKMFKMVKLRSMIINADKTGVDSTSADDKRITWIGTIIRKYKIDELFQLWNVFLGDMSLVGPRPNVVRHGVELYTKVEMDILNVRPGITDIASIVFSDEGNILEGKEYPDIAYNQLIRPWKSRLGLLYIENQSLFGDIKIIVLTAFAIISKPIALNGINKILKKNDADPELIKVALRQEALYPFPPPGSTEIVQNRD